MREEVKKWFEQAKSDLSAAQNSVTTKNFDWACFQSQQAAEKGLKALLLQKQDKIIKTHDLVFLSTEINLPEHFKEACKELTLIYVHVRYPTATEVRDLKNKSSKYIVVVRELLRWIEKQL